MYRGTIAKALREELGSVRLTDLTAADVQKALTSLASRVSTRTVQIAHNVLVRAIRQAERDDLVGRNVASLVKPPKGQGGQWVPVAEAGFDHEQVAVFVWRAERAGGDTKTPESRRMFALPRKCVEALREHRVRQAEDRLAAGPLRQDHELVFASG